MKTFLRQPHQGRSGYVALMVFLVAYAVTVAFVIAPKQVMSAMDAAWTLQSE